MIFNSMSKLYSDHKKNTQRSVCSSIFKKLKFLRNNSSDLKEMNSFSSEETRLKFKNEIKIETNYVDSLKTKDTLIKNYLTAASFQNPYEYNITLSLADEPIILNEKKASYSLIKRDTLNLKKKISNKIKEFTSSSKTYTHSNEALSSIFNKNDSKANFLYKSFARQLLSSNSMKDHLNSIKETNTSSKSKNSNSSTSISTSNSISRSNSFESIRASSSSFIRKNAQVFFDHQMNEANREVNASECHEHTDNDIASSSYSSDSKSNAHELKLSKDSVRSFPKINQILDLKIQRLPGENMGMNFSVHCEGFIVVESVAINGAAYRASYENGLRCPVRQNDEIIEINQVSLMNMKTEDIISMIAELPLRVQIRLRRKSNEYLLSSSESLNSENFMQRTIGTTDGHLTAGDILYKFNHESLINKSKHELISAFESINQVCELKVIRKLLNSNTNGSRNEIPYYNEIFAKNSIKLPVRSSNYEQPDALSMKRSKSRRKLKEMLNNSDEKENLNNFLNKLPQLVDTEIMTSVNEGFENKAKFNETKIESKNTQLNVELSSSCDQTITSLHDDNWIFLADLKEETNNLSSSSSSASSLNSKYKDTFLIASQNDCKHSSPTNFLSDEDVFSRCLTNSSCHSERSIARLSCMILCESANKDIIETDKLSQTEFLEKLDTHPPKVNIEVEDLKETDQIDDNTRFISKIDIRFNEKSNKKDILPKQEYHPENILGNSSEKLCSKEIIDSMKKSPEGTIVKKIVYNFQKLKSISEEKSIDQLNDSFWNLPGKSLYQSNNLKPEPIAREYKFNDLKKYMHDELLQLLRDKSTNNIRQNSQLKAKEEPKCPSINLTASKNSTQSKSKMNIQLLNNTSILDAEKSTLTNKNNIIFSINANTKELCDQKINPKNITRENKTLNSPSLVENSTLKLSVKEKAKLFMKENTHFNSRIDRKKSLTTRTEKSRPLSQILNESLKQISNQSLYVNGKTNISLSTNKLDLNKINENCFLDNVDSLDIYSHTHDNDEQKIMSVKEKITYFSSIYNQKKSSSKKFLNFNYNYQ